MGEKELQSWHDETIHPAAVAMGHRYFTTKPSQPITVLLFSGKESYEHYANKLFKDRGISIYGYYKPRERTLVMQLAASSSSRIATQARPVREFSRLRRKITTRVRIASTT